ncbi:MAG TPA: RsmB/NOP family class I SAM-dependent RNA methyltransferase [Anaeromyxobacteraceae bacterium]|nr:RsmB/NOP family class I SAM-dependent RNA methyltransferase [Anaeromyxobacteraceae bacterium]
MKRAPRAVRTDLVDAAVLEVHGLVAEEGWLADRALERVLRREARLYAAERRAVAEAVYGIQRLLGQLTWLAGGARLDPSTAYALWLARAGAAPPDAAARRLGVEPALVVRALDRADARIAALADPAERLAVEGSVPRWIAEAFLAERPAPEVRALLAAMNRRAPLTVRANALKGTREALRERLAGEGTAAEPTRFSPWGLALDGHANAFALRSFQDGWFEIQDEGSQLLALAVGARPGQKVADCCAGAGGKSLALAAEMRGKGALHALDADAGRLEEARRRARRAGVHNLRTRAVAADAAAEAQLADLEGACDRVLVDAPCSGLGTLRRKPDARWRLRREDPARFARLQEELGLRYARLVRPGGRFVYATCSIGRTENAAVAAALLAARPDLRPLPLEAALGEGLARSLGAPAGAHELQLWPDVHGTDGFFVAAFQRA